MAEHPREPRSPGLERGRREEKRRGERERRREERLGEECWRDEVLMLTSPGIE